MSSDIRDFLTQESQIKELELTHSGKKFLLRGSPNTPGFTDALLMSSEKVKTAALHWSQVINLERPPEKHVKIEDRFVKQIILVHLTLVPPDEMSPYNLTDIALLSHLQPSFFMLMSAKAMEIFGFMSGDKEASGEEQVEAFNRYLAGNSPTSISDGNSNSTDS
jgi:hypothetical protein